MQLAAFSLRHLRYLRENNTQEYSIYLRENQQHIISETTHKR